MLQSVLALFAMFSGCRWGSAEDVSEPAWLDTVQLLSPRRPLRDWSLQRGDGSAFSEQAFVGRTSLVLVGYARCPDVCPNTLTLLARFSPQSPATQLVFLSVDPEHDRDGLKDYAAFFTPELVAVTGEPPEIDHAATQLGAAYTFADGLVDHSTSLFVVDENANVTGVIRPDTPESVLRDLGRLTERRPPRVRTQLSVPPRPPGAPGVAYGHITATEPSELVRITSPEVERVELHRTVLTDTRASMVPIPSLTLDPAEPTRLAPGALHLMLLGTVRDPTPRLELHFASGASALVATHPGTR
ncbi:MAG: SCO family protein [Myxococcota bacterium]